MSVDLDQIAAAFCSHRFAMTHPYMAAEIKWNIVSQETIIDRCNKSAKFLETVAPTITKLKIYRPETCVVVEGAAQSTHLSLTRAIGG